jgi:uncharacterized membrane protein (UPF0127 family)
MRSAGALLLVVSLLACGGDDNDSQAGTVVGDVATPQGFETVAATATAPDGTVCEVCLWLADTSPTRARGLMGVTDLGGADGMLFRYEAPHTGTFWMKDTLLPLSIAFYDAGGAFLDSFAMQPCESEPCLHHPTPSDFVYAIEVPEGGLEPLGLIPGSTLSVSDTTCRVG